MSEIEKFLLKFAETFIAWQQVEMWLGFIFIALIEPGKREYAWASFKEVPLKSKFDMCGSLMELRIKDSELLARWNNLHNRGKKRTTDRNHLAHWHMTTILATHTHPDMPILVESTFDSLNMQTDISKLEKGELFLDRIDFPRLEEIKKNFLLFVADLLAFQNDLVGHLALLKKPPSP